MKQTVKYLYEIYGEDGLKKLLFDLKNNQNLSFEQIRCYFNEKNIICSSALLRRLFKKLDIIPIPKNRSGANNHFYGRKHTEISKNRISKRHKENGYSKGSRNYFYGKSKDKSPAWKGGKSRRTALFYASQEWYDKRLEIMKRDNFKCKECGFIPSKVKKSLNVHHIIPLSKDWNKRLNNNNLITLCVNCHKNTFGKELLLIDIYRNILFPITLCGL